MINIRPSLPFGAASTADSLPDIRVGFRYNDAATYQQTLEHLLHSALDCTNAAVGYVMLLNPAETHLATEFATTRDMQFNFPRGFAISDGIEGQVVITGKVQSMHAPPATAGKRSRKPDPATHWQQALCAPLLAGEPNNREPVVIGTLTLLHIKKDRKFDKRAEEKVQLIAAMMSTAVVNARAFASQHSALMDSLSRLIENLEAKSPLTARHSQNVATLCRAIAEKLQLPESAQAELVQGALLHEIGMLGIPESLISKPERLTEEEYVLLQKHTIIGYDICKPLGFSEQMLSLIRNHHEHLDGSGYPDGLRSSQLPLSLRIMCVAVAFDAMNSYRPYRERLSASKILEQLNRFSGSQFDPIVVETLKELMASGQLNQLYGLDPIEVEAEPMAASHAA